MPAPDEYPNAAGHRGVDTSMEAADAMLPSLNRLRRIVLRTVRERGPTGATSHEVAAIAGLENTSIQPRLTELHHAGLVRDSGDRRRNRSGRRARVFIVTERGRRAHG